MGKLDRKLRRKRQNAQKKSAKKQIRNVEKSLQNMPQNCHVCSRGFDKEDIDKWMLRVDLNGAVMTCPQCYQERMDASKAETTES